jgi:hypothetical protein
MDTRAAHGGEPGALASPRAKAARPEVVGSNPTGPTISFRLSADVLWTIGVVSVRVDFVGSERELLPDQPRQLVLRLCHAGTATPSPWGGGWSGAIITIPIPSRSRKSVSSAIGRKGMKDQIDTSFPRLRCLSRGSRFHMRALPS